MCLSLFLDDLYYYKFHRYNYTDSAQFFMNKIDIITTLRLNPWFLNDTILFGSINVAGDQDIIYSN